GVMIAVPLTGVGMVWAKGKTIAPFGLFVLHPPFAANRALAKRIEGLHEILAWSLALLVVGHVGVALWHHFVLRDGLLDRMRLGRGSRQTTNS
ncbi:MAG: cytochrome b, partial [Alphaproteobacteria bacterium]|nr:cytochrome b [Alphaproteobacteria bacterium]